MRYKGRPTEETIARDFRHCGEIAVPLGGFGRQIDRMHEHLRGIGYRQGRGRREGERITRWRFARREDAQALPMPSAASSLSEQFGPAHNLQLDERPTVCLARR